MGDFQAIGWGVAPNWQDDVGTDLLLMARDTTGLDLGLLVGAQVKTERAPFKRPVRKKGTVVGFSWRDRNSDHTDAWLGHGLPHILVLYDLERRESYWADVTTDSVESTGKGVKIFVPVEQRIEEANRDALLQVAASGRVMRWEGTAWSKVTDLSPDESLRYALITPRLVAPHPNAERSGAPTSYEAVALLVTARLRDVTGPTRDTGIPSIAEALESNEWPWRLFGAFGRLLLGDSVDELLSVLEQTSTSDEMAAAAAIAGAALIQTDRTDEAIPLLENATADENVPPVNHAWLTMQLARALAEVGRLDEARDLAVRVYGVAGKFPNDPTATALAGVAAILIFNTSGWGALDVQQVVRATDTAALWWVTQAASRGLTASVRRSFETWARRAPHRIGDASTDINGLASAAVISGSMGDHSGWADMTGLLAMRLLSRSPIRVTLADARDALHALRLAGDEKAVRQAVEALLEDGPIAAVQDELAKTRLHTATRSNARASLALVQYGGDVLETHHADAFIDWLLATLDRPADFVDRTAPSYLLNVCLADTLEGVVRAGSVTKQREVVEYVLRLPAGLNGLEVNAWTRVADTIPAAAWTAQQRSRAAKSARKKKPPLRSVLLGVASASETDAGDELDREVLSGSFAAVAAYGDVRQLSAKGALAAIRSHSDAVRSKLESAKAGTVSHGSDVAADLAILNAWHPEEADWTTLLGFLRARAIPASQKEGSLTVLAPLGDRLPGLIRKRIGVVSERLAEAEQARSLFGGVEEAWGASAVFSAIAGIADREASMRRLQRLLRGDSSHRQWAARLVFAMDDSVSVGALAALAFDHDPWVRASAAGVLGSLVAMGKANSLIEEVLEGALDDPGVVVARSVVRALTHSDAEPERVEPWLARLRGHPAASVRTAADASP